MSSTTMASSKEGGDIPIIDPGPNDVLLGRGSGPREFQGNRQFRSLITKERKLEYKACHKNKEKSDMAKDLLKEVHDLGGRFLKRVQHSQEQEAVWTVAPTNIAVEKCMQALREKDVVSAEAGGTTRRRRSTAKGMRRSSSQSTAEESVSSNEKVSSPRAETAPQRVESGNAALSGLTTMDKDSMGGLSTIDVDTATAVRPHPIIPPNFTPMFPSSSSRTLAASAGDNKNPPVVLSMHNSSPFRQGVTGTMFPQQEFRGMQQNLYASMRLGSTTSSSSYIPPSLPVSSSPASRGSASAFSHQMQASHESTDGWLRNSNGDLGNLSLSSSAAASAPPNEQTSSQEDEVLEYLLSEYYAWDGPRFTEEEAKLELASMTNEEREAALVDMFGRRCSLQPESKRPRRDLDRAVICFLVKQMRLEIERIPESEKRALLEAQSKCGEEEFSDERLEQFLRCEGMNTKLGAQRFVRYWEGRREVFGPEKFVLPMTLAGALCDDLAALEAGVLILLPHVDSSGRQILFHEACRHTREGYSSESLVRAIWYVKEVASQENTDFDCGHVMIMWDKHTTMWDYDRKVHKAVTRFQTCWPVKLASTHICCAPRIVVRLLKPIFFALLNKSTRTRMVLHDEPEHEILGVLSQYGILRHMLPTEMGGTLNFSQQEWIANRRAAELEEI